MNKPKVGQELYSLNIGNRARNIEQKLTKVIVVKVGRKYFSCSPNGKEWNAIQYHISDWSENTSYSRDSKLYETEKEYEDEREASTISKLIHESFEYGRNKDKLPLDVLRVISSMISDHVKTD